MTSRAYRMTARAEAVESTRRGIQDAYVELTSERLFATISLNDVAQRAGVSVQTILRHFGTKERLREETVAYMAAVVTSERRASDSTIDDAVAVLVDHYEKRGAMMLMLLAQERTDDFAAQFAKTGRDLHRRWVRNSLAPDDDADLLDLLIVATDLSTWKLLRHDHGRSVEATQSRIKHLVTAILAMAGKD